ncbi:MAG: GNAT family N-acetyltransferase [Verrucomicrobiota bacterium]
MGEKSKNDPLIREARSEDISEIISMVKELADFEHLSDEMVATEADYQESFFGEKPAAEALVAEIEGYLIGYAIFFSTFSTFVGRAGIWLEDLYVREEHRKKGIGKALLKEVGDLARKRNSGRYEWAVLDWNENAIQLYRQMGGEILDEWRIVRLDRNGIETLEEK